MKLYRVVILGLLCSSAAQAGEVVTRKDNQTLRGAIHVRGDQLGVDQDGQTRWVSFGEIKRVDFKAPSGAKVPAGQGLRGEYYFGRNFQRLMLLRTDPGIDYSWTERLPHPALCPTGREFSVRWTGRLVPAHKQGIEKYQIIGTSDDGMRVWLRPTGAPEAAPIIDRWWDQSASDYAKEVELEAGREYEIRVEYFNGQDLAVAKLSWSSPSVPRQVIGPENLRLPAGNQDLPKNRGLLIDTDATDGGPRFLRVLGDDSTGLQAEYFIDKDLRQLAFIRFDAGIDIHYHGDQTPDPTMAPEGSVRWSGMVEPRYTENYRFHVEAHRKVRLWVNGELKLERWNAEGGDFTTEEIPLVAGRKVPIKVEYSSSQNFMLCRLRWSSPSQHRDVIPPSAYSLPADRKFVKPAVGLLSPEANTVVVAPKGFNLRATGSSPRAAIQQVEFFEKTSKVGAATSGPIYQLQWGRPGPGVYQLCAKLTNSMGITALSDTAMMTVLGRGDGSLPAPWGDLYLTNNEHITMGVASMSQGKFQLDKVTGTLLSNSDHDAGHFVIQKLEGDGQIVARLASLAPRDPAAMTMAGITIRQNMTNRCRQTTLAAGVTPPGESGVHFIRRQEKWSAPVSTEKRMEVPCWLRLVRHGGRVHAYVSSDGKAWELMATERFEASPQVFVGLVATAETKTSPASAVFEQVQVIPGSPVLAYSERGFVTRGGTFVACDVHTIDQNLLRFNRAGREDSAPLNEVAMIIYRPLLADHQAKIPAGSMGVLMGSGDFFEGELKTLRGGQVQVSSVLFGLKRVSIADDVTSIVLRDVDRHPTPFVVATTDRSIYRARSLRSQGSDLVIEDASLGSVTVPLGLLSQIQAQ